MSIGFDPAHTFRFVLSRHAELPAGERPAVLFRHITLADEELIHAAFNEPEHADPQSFNASDWKQRCLDAVARHVCGVKNQGTDDWAENAEWSIALSRLWTWSDLCEFRARLESGFLGIDELKALRSRSSKAAADSAATVDPTEDQSREADATSPDSPDSDSPAPPAAARATPAATATADAGGSLELAPHDL